MIKYYTRACNFYYGKSSEKLIRAKKSLPLNGNKFLSFDKVEIFRRYKKKVKSRIIDIKKIKYLPVELKNQIKLDLKKITAKKSFLDTKKHILMGILNLTPDSFSDGGKFNTLKKADKRILHMIKSGADIIDVGGESTRPGSKIISTDDELKRVQKIIQRFKKKTLKYYFLSTQENQK